MVVLNLSAAQMWFCEFPQAARPGSQTARKRGFATTSKMKKTTTLSALAAIAAFTAFTLAAGELVVSPGGLTPHGALEAIRAAKAKNDASAWTVRVKPGIYALERTLIFTPADSGTPQAPVTWIGENGAVISGGAPLAGWKDTGKGWWSAPVPRGADGKPVYFEQLWVNGRRASRARLPNVGYFKVAKPTIAPRAGASSSYVERVVVGDGVKELAALAPDEMPYAQMCVVHAWSFARRILRGFDPATGTVETWSPRDWYSWLKWDGRMTLVCFENVRSAFDAPGEWFYDARAGEVLYRPCPGERLETLQVVAPSAKLSRLVEFRGEPDAGRYVHDIAFKGLTFAASDATSPDGGKGPTETWQYQAAIGCDGLVTAEGVQRLSWEDCVVRNTGNYAFRFNDGCTSNRIVRCTLEDLGAGGVWMGASSGYVAAGESLTRRIITRLAPRSTAFNEISDCTIRQGGRFNPEGTGVALTHVSDSKVLHCDIYDFYYTGVSVGWTWGFSGSVAQRNEVAFNRIYDLGKGVMCDMGGVYTLGTSFGTWVHDNVIHDVKSYSYGGWALFADEGSEGILMERNLCWNTTDGGFNQHYGAGCVIRNNVFAWNRMHGAVRTARQVVQNIPCTLHFVNNIVVVRNGPLVGRGTRGVGGVWAANLWYDYSGRPNLDGLGWDAWAACGKEVGGVYADPQFEDPGRNDFRLKPGSPALALGFRPLDAQAAGPRR